MLKKIFLLFLLLTVLPCFAQNQVLLQSKVTVNHIPNGFYGNWRVKSDIISTDTVGIFKTKSIDFWNISRCGNVITIENPFSGASQSVTVESVKTNYIKFRKVGDYDNKKLTDTVTLTLGKDTFWGINEIKLDTISSIDGHVMKTEKATYQIKGEKLSGTSIGE